MKFVVPSYLRRMACVGTAFFAWLYSFGATCQTLTDPGFEVPYNAVSDTGVAGQIANGWNDNTSWASGIDLLYSQESTPANVHGGAASQKIQINAGFAQFAQWLTFRAGRTTASVWMKSQSPTWVILSLRLGPAPYTTYGSTFVRLTNGWQQVTVDGITEAAGGGLIINSVGTGTLWVDDASLTFQSNVFGVPQTLSPSNTPIPAVYFGLHPNHFYESPNLPWPNLTFGTVRSHDCAPFWAQVEPNAPVNGIHSYNWSNLDDFINRAQSHGAQVIYTFYQTPTWASSTNGLDPYYYAGGNGCPKNVADYSNYVSAVATRYQGRIAAYETWNEPDVSFWSGTPAQMAGLEKTCAAAVRSADAHALVLAPPPSGGFFLSPLSWYDSYLAAGGGTNADVLPLHLYDATPEQDIQHVAAFRSLLATYGLGNKPVWNDETGWGLGGTDTFPMDQTVNYVARAYVLDWAAGLSRFCWYLWNDTANVGVRASSPGQWTVPTPAAVAYQQVQNWLLNATMTACAADTNGNWICQITRTNGYLGRIVWSPGRTNNFTLPAGVLRSRDLAGNFTSLASLANIPVNDTPILLESTPLQISARFSPTHVFTVQLQGLSSAKYALDTATNLLSPANWTAVATNLTDASGASTFTNSVTRPAVYFRCRFVP